MWDRLRKLWRWFSELDTTVSVFNWIKLGIGIVSGSIAGFVAWLDAQPASILFILALAALLIAVYLVNGVVWLWRRLRVVRPKEKAAQTEQLEQNTDIKTTQHSTWSALAEKDPANTLVILSAGIERSRLQDVHPAWEIFFTAYNGGVGEVRLVSAGGSFKVRGQAYPTPVELKSATPAKHGEITLFTVRQWIDQQDVPQEQQGQNHVVLQLSDLKIEAIARDPVSGNERPFIILLPDHLQFDVRHHWRIHPELFARFYRERLGADDNGAAQEAETVEKPIEPRPDTPVCEAINDWLLDQSQWGIGRNHNQALGELRQAGHDGDIAIWGRRRRTSMDELTYDGTDAPLTEISKDYWLTGDFDPLHCLMSDAPNGCCTQPDAGIDSANFTIYQDVQVCRRQMEARWRPKNSH